MPKRYKTADESDTRSFSLPSVLELRKKHGWNKRDETIIQEQLGYVPGCAYRVAARVGKYTDLLKDEDSTPVVLQMYPLNARHVSSRRIKKKRKVSNEKDDGEQAKSTVAEPFPTMLWLVHPKLKAAIATLEKEGFGLELEKKLYNSKDYESIMTRAHLAHGKERFNSLTDKDKEFVKKQPWAPALQEVRGISGIVNYKAVKCLHAHTAHFLSDCGGHDDNIVGKWVMEELERRLAEEKG